MVNKEYPDWIRQILVNDEAEALVMKTSREVTDVLHEYADGKVVVYGDRGKSRATRTEITVEGGHVIFHKNPSQKVFGAARYSELEVIPQDDQKPVASLMIDTDPKTSLTNPLYVFMGKEGVVGHGTGQHLDLSCAANLLKVQIPEGWGDYVTQPVLTWVQSILG